MWMTAFKIEWQTFLKSDSLRNWVVKLKAYKTYLITRQEKSFVLGSFQVGKNILMENKSFRCVPRF